MESNTMEPVPIRASGAGAEGGASEGAAAERGAAEGAATKHDPAKHGAAEAAATERGAAEGAGTERGTAEGAATKHDPAKHGAAEAAATERGAAEGAATKHDPAKHGAAEAAAIEGAAAERGATAGAAASAGVRFARAVAAQDPVALRACLAEGLDFQALTPGRHWQAASPGVAVDEIVLGMWFAPDAEVKELKTVAEGWVAGRSSVTYLMLVHRWGQDHLVEQQAYYDAAGGRITWMRVLCSGYQPVPGADDVVSVAGNGAAAK